MGLVSVFLLSPLPWFPPRSRGRRALLNALIVKNQSIPAAWRQTQEGCDVGVGIRGLLIKLNSPSGPGEAERRGARRLQRTAGPQGRQTQSQKRRSVILPKRTINRPFPCGGAFSGLKALLELAGASRELTHRASYRCVPQTFLWLYGGIQGVLEGLQGEGGTGQGQGQGQATSRTQL